jgi:hypothetical protein
VLVVWFSVLAFEYLTVLVFQFLCACVCVECMCPRLCVFQFLCMFLFVSL